MTLFTSSFAYGERPPADGYALEDVFYRAAPARLGRARSATRLALHVPDMLRYRRRAAQADVVHFQWLSVQQIDARLLPRGRPLVLTAHDILPREPRGRQREAQRRLYDHVDAVVVHSEHGRARLLEEVAVDPAKVSVIPHGAFDHLSQMSDEVPLPAELAAVDKPVVLIFGIMRPYKGIDVALQAWSGIEDAELWVVGHPRMETAPLRAAAPPGVRFVERFIDEREIAAFFRRADLVVLPYREIDQSGVLFTALAFGSPLLLSDVGGFPEVAATGAAQTVAAGDSEALHAAMSRLLAAPAARAALGARALEVSREHYGWDPIARKHLDLYERLTGAAR